MTKFMNPSFNSGANSDAYRDGWDRIFGTTDDNYRTFIESLDEFGNVIWEGWQCDRCGDTWVDSPKDPITKCRKCYK